MHVSQLLAIACLPPSYPQPIRDAPSLVGHVIRSFLGSPRTTSWESVAESRPMGFRGLGSSRTSPFPPGTRPMGGGGEGHQRTDPTASGRSPGGIRTTLGEHLGHPGRPRWSDPRGGDPTFRGSFLDGSRPFLLPSEGDLHPSPRDRSSLPPGTPRNGGI